MWRFIVELQIFCRNKWKQLVTFINMSINCRGGCADFWILQMVVWTRKQTPRLIFVFSSCLSHSIVHLSYLALYYVSFNFHLITHVYVILHYFYRDRKFVLFLSQYRKTIGLKLVYKFISCAGRPHYLDLCQGLLTEVWAECISKNSRFCMITSRIKMHQ